ncbi:transporter [Ganoderma sinense ZZ0214-1]|uniref:Transporter n=1 Tax=Ganoderma sinense ZZ0214-1 TaxID=1077348 RepID=A0A2G8RPU8_9APHY|nr:transporter [Ganoderma sinense ZZ0214-1]
MGIVQRLQVDHLPGLTYSELFLQNEDLLPVPEEKRTWGYWNFIAFWVADSFNINTWMIASSMIQLGLSWWQAWICVWIGGADKLWRVGEPVVCVQQRRNGMASIGGSCVLVMLRAMWPSVNDIPNHLPASSGTTTKGFMCFFLFWLISLPAIWFPIHKIRHLFTVKAIVVSIAGITFFIWCIVKAHGVGPIIHQPATLSGSALGWGMVSSIMSCISNMATLVTNAPDFASRSSNPSAALWPQFISVPLCFSIVSFFGVIVSSSSQAIYGEAIWSPIDLLGMFLDRNPSHATRFGVWFISASFIIAQLGTNISANSISAGCDLTALLPRFINIRRGGYIAAIVGLVMLPWNLLKSSNQFTSYLSAYSVFLSSIAGVMITDYYLVHKGHYSVADLYHSRKDGWYAYTYGINFRAYAAYISGILINVVGFAGATGRTVPLAATHIYEMSFFTGFGVSALVYWSLNRLFPVRGASECATFEEVDVSSGDGVLGAGLEGSDEAGSDGKSVASGGVRSVRSKA